MPSQPPYPTPKPETRKRREGQEGRDEECKSRTGEGPLGEGWADEGGEEDGAGGGVRGVAEGVESARNHRSPGLSIEAPEFVPNSSWGFALPEAVVHHHPGAMQQGYTYGYGSMGCFGYHEGGGYTYPSELGMLEKLPSLEGWRLLPAAPCRRSANSAVTRCARWG